MTSNGQPEPPRSLRLDIDGCALAHNWRALNRLSGSARAGAAVKANAYGIGVDAALPVLRDAGCTDWFVAHWSEVPQVLRHVPPEQVSVLHGPLRREDTEFAKSVGVRPVLNSLHQVDLWLASGGSRCDLMVDTGMNRLGLALNELSDPRIAKLDVEVLMSHLASADENSALNELQRARFAEACSLVPAKQRSLANSAGIELGAAFHFDLTRPGLSLYGGVPVQGLDNHIRQVAHLAAAIVQCRELKAGDTVGYNATYTAMRDMRVGVVSIGYADGFLRCWGEKGWLERDGQRMPMVGRVSMDMIAVDISGNGSITEGDWLNIPYSLPRAAELSGLSQYELLTLLGNRFAR